MKKKLSGSVVFCIFCLFIMGMMPVFGASFERVYSNDSWPEEYRTAGNTVFTAGSYYNGTYSLYADYNGNITRLSSTFNGGTVVSNGKKVFFCAKSSGKWYMYRGNVRTGKSKKLVKIANGSHNICLEGYYGGSLYFVLDSPEGIFKKVDLSTKKIKKLKTNVTGTDWKGRYFVLYDGTGAGYSYLGLWDSRKGKMRTVVKTPVLWASTDKYVYYIEITEGDSWNLMAGKSITASIKRYTYSNGKRKTLVKSIDVKKIDEFDDSHIVYTDTDGTVRTIEW